MAASALRRGRRRVLSVPALSEPSRAKITKDDKAARKHKAKMAKRAAAAAKLGRERQKKEPKTLPVTVLSGFLGSGKTTLLKHILQSNEHGLRIAVIVNDIGAINVDGAHIKRTEEKVVELQNGCICCTLRGDLLEELVRLYDLGEYDYVITESSGISEPEQVAESFDPEIAEMMMLLGSGADGLDDGMKKVLKRVIDAGGLDRFARLDTAVSVVDAFTMLTDFETDQIVADRRDDADPESSEGGQTVSHLLVDQIEFANVVVLNKTDMVDEETLGRLRSLIARMNHDAKVIETNYGRIEVKEIVNTGLFSLERARLGAGWLQDIHELAVREVNGKKTVTPKPETEEYNVRNFVYVRTRPFHPRRLWELVYDKFILRMPQSEEEEEDEDEDEGMGDDEDVDDDGDGDDANEAGGEPEDEKHPGEEQDDLVPPPDEVILKNRRADPLLRRLFRSKGGFFLATRPARMGDWSQAGAALELTGGTSWYCIAPEDEVTTGNEEVDAMIRHDVRRGGEWGDRRQELVFIGEKLDTAGVEAWLDSALLTDDEWEAWQGVMRDVELDDKGRKEKLEKLFEDGFPDWPGEEGKHVHDDDVEGGICVL